MGVRVLGATRLSHETDASTSLERQRETVTRWAELFGHTIVHVAEDSDVSGATNPFDRADLGPWFKPPKVAQWDILVFAKLDRISRSLVDFAALLEWCEANGKALVSVADSADFGTPNGKMFGKLIILLAEWERETMRERRADAARKLYSRGGYNGGGSLPWGYRTVRRDGKIELDLDPDLVVKITEIVDAVIAGESVQSVAKWAGLDHANLLRRLKSPVLKGLVVYDGELVRGDDGMPLTRPPVMTTARWEVLQDVLNRNSTGAGVPRDANPWLHVIACRACGQDLYYQRWAARPSYAYWNHKPSLKKYHGEDADELCKCSFRAADVEAQITPLLMRGLGDKYVPDVVELPAEDHTEELAQVQEAIGDLDRDRYERGLLRGDDGTARYVSMMSKLEARLEELKAHPVLPARREVVPSSDTFRERWEGLESDRERGALLRRMRIRLLVFKDGQGRTRVWLRQERPGAPKPPSAHQWVQGLMGS